MLMMTVTRHVKQMTRFTDTYLKGLKPQDKTFRIYERATIPGFIVRVSTVGLKTFHLHYTVNGKRRYYHIGKYPLMSLAKAREVATEIRSIVDQGIDPMAVQNTEDGSTRQLFEYYTDTMKEQGKTSWRETRRALMLYSNKILDKPAADIEPLHIRTILHDIMKRGSMVQSNRMRSYLNRAF